MSIKETDNKTGGARYVTGLLTEEALYKKSPQELTALLYEACIEALEDAVQAINDKKYDKANQKLTKTNDILTRLGAGINYEAGIIADQLDALYNHMADKVIEANLKKDTKIIEEVLAVIQPISSSWNEAMKKKATQKPNHSLRQKSNAYEQFVMTDSSK